MNLEMERKAFIGEMAALVLTMDTENFLRLREAFQLDRKNQEEAEQINWFDLNTPAIREAIRLSQKDAEAGCFVAHQDVLQKARKVIRTGAIRLFGQKKHPMST